MQEHDRSESTSRTSEPNADPDVSVVFRHLELHLAGGTTSLAEVAGALGIGKRTLQRRLQRAGIQFRQVLQEVRLRRAAELQANGITSREELARALGYRDARSLRHRSRSSRPPALDVMDDVASRKVGLPGFGKIAAVRSQSN